MSSTPKPFFIIKNKTNVGEYDQEMPHSHPADQPMALFAILGAQSLLMYQVSSPLWFLEIAIYGHGSHLGHVTRRDCTNYYSAISKIFHLKFEYKILKTDPILKRIHKYMYNNIRGQI